MLLVAVCHQQLVEFSGLLFHLLAVLRDAGVLVSPLSRPCLYLLIILLQPADLLIRARSFSRLDLRCSRRAFRPDLCCPVVGLGLQRAVPALGLVQLHGQIVDGLPQPRRLFVCQRLLLLQLLDLLVQRVLPALPLVRVGLHRTHDAVQRVGHDVVCQRLCGLAHVLLVGVDRDAAGGVEHAGDDQELFAGVVRTVLRSGLREPVVPIARVQILVQLIHADPALSRFSGEIQLLSEQLVLDRLQPAFTGQLSLEFRIEVDFLSFYTASYTRERLVVEVHCFMNVFKDLAREAPGLVLQLLRIDRAV